MAARQSLRYGVVAVVVAVAIILAAVATSTTTLPAGTGAKTQQSTQQSQPTQLTTESQSQQTTAPTGNFAVLLTDPPNVPPGTTQLNLTYSAISLQVSFYNGTSTWMPIQASGTVDLLSLVNVTQTLGSVTIPANSTVHKIQFIISAVTAVVNGQDFTVTTLSNELLVSIANAGKTQSLSEVLLDLRPTLVQIQATNSTNGNVAYYVLVPSATAIVKQNVSKDLFKTGYRFKLSDNDTAQLYRFQHAFSQNVTVTSTTLSVAGNVTQFSITLRNSGNMNATLFGLALSGRFNSTATCPTFTTSTTTTSTQEHQHNSTTTFTSRHGGGRGGCFNLVLNHPQMIPFGINGTSLIPFMGFGGIQPFKSGPSLGRAPLITLQPGQSVTLDFSGVIQLGFGPRGFMPSVVLIPISGDTYTVQLLGEGFRMIQVNAT